MPGVYLRGGWVPTPTEGWGETAEILTESGKAWPEQAAITDLRVFVNNTGKVPGRPTLRRRWNWSDWAVKQLLKDEERWHDPAKADEYRVLGLKRAGGAHSASPPPADRQPTASPPPAADSTNLDNGGDTASPPPAHRQPTASEPPHARCRTRNNNKEQEQELDPPSHPPTLPGISPPPADPISSAAVNEVLAFWGQQVNPALGKRIRPARSFGDKVRRQVRARIADPDIGLDLLLNGLRVLTDEDNELGEFHRSNAREGKANYLSLGWFLKDSERIHSWADSYKQTKSTEATTETFGQRLERERAEEEARRLVIEEKLKRAREIKAARIAARQSEADAQQVKPTGSWRYRGAK